MCVQRVTVLLMVMPGDLFRNLKHTHALHFGNSFSSAITCSQGGCKRTFRYRYALIRHIEKNHVSVDSDEEDFHDDDDGNRVPNNENDANGDNSDAERDDYFWDDFSQEKITEMVAVGIARMKASSSVVQSTIDMVVADSSNLFLDIVGGLKERTSKFLCERGFREDDE